MLRGMLMVAVWMAGAGSAGALTTALPDGAVLWSEKQAVQVRKRSSLEAQRIHEAVAAGQAEQAVDLLRSQYDPVLREASAAAVLAWLQDSPPRDDVGALLDWAQVQPVKVFVQHQETLAPAYLPLFDIAQRARDVRRLWAEFEQRAAWSARWSSDARAALQRLLGADDDEEQRAAEALGRLDAADFARSRAELAAAPAAQVPVPVWLALAEREADAEALRAALQRGDAVQQLAAVQLSKRLDVDAAEALLGDWEADAGIGSAATLALVPRLVEADRPQALRARLADPVRRDATAAALARAADQARTQALLDGMHDALQGKAERVGWQRLLILLDDPRQRARWRLGAEGDR